MNYITTPHQAELNAAEVMRGWGYLDAIATIGGADGGIDVRSKGALAQVKWKGAVAGRPDLQRLWGAGATETDKTLFFFAASGYSKGAMEYADQVGIGLFTYDPVGTATAVNHVSLPGPYPATTRSWLSPDYLSLLHGFQRVGTALGFNPTNYSSRKSRPRRRA